MSLVLFRGVWRLARILVLGAVCTGCGARTGLGEDCEEVLTPNLVAHEVALVR